MKKHFAVLVSGSILFLLFFYASTHIVMIGSSVPDEAATFNSGQTLIAIRLLGLYIVFVALLIGHAILISGHQNHRNDGTNL